MSLVDVRPVISEVEDQREMEKARIRVLHLHLLTMK
jgi:hypothetical protein